MPKEPKGFRAVEPEGGLPETYSNHVALSVTRDDVRIAFGQIVPLKGQVVDAAFEWPEGNAKTTALPGIVAERVAVTVSWAQAKRVSQALAAAVSNYEARNGNIKEDAI